MLISTECDNINSAATCKRQFACAVNFENVLLFFQLQLSCFNQLQIQLSSWFNALHVKFFSFWFLCHSFGAYLPNSNLLWTQNAVAISNEAAAVTVAILMTTFYRACCCCHLSLKDVASLGDGTHTTTTTPTNTPSKSTRLSLSADVSLLPVCRICLRFCFTFANQRRLLFSSNCFSFCFLQTWQTFLTAFPGTILTLSALSKGLNSMRTCNLLKCNEHGTSIH